jgi:hypothetical protein
MFARPALCMGNILTRTKTTIVVDDRLLKQFRDLASSKHGTSRMLSSELEEALRAFSPLEVIKSLAARLDVKIDRYPFRPYFWMPEPVMQPILIREKTTLPSALSAPAWPRELGLDLAL